ncbi:hypothetical protein [Duganella levis]|uniref:Uncharacterized protein n=1 Tax=Duganella levis TaxID=2692169 RepID=A0ABW9W9C5_9BURK|nr:hypothetical protein [Duganella levis]MYN30283.1 hypothetical protein [Duganella levis]
MATWQFDLFLTPKGSEHGLDIPTLPARSALHAQENLVKCLGQPWLMLEDWIVYGVENGTRVDFHFDDTGGVEVIVRLDASANNSAVVDAICALALDLECRYFDAQEKQFIDALPQAILQALVDSKAAKFVGNPRDFIHDID